MGIDLVRDKLKITHLGLRIYICPHPLLHCLSKCIIDSIVPCNVSSALHSDRGYTFSKYLGLGG